MSPPPRDERRSDASGLVAVLSLAVILRVLGMRFGLPHTLARPDEDATVAIALKFFTRSFNPGFFDWPSLFMYAVAAAFVVYFNIGRIAGWFGRDASFIEAGIAHSSKLYLVARVVSVAAGTATVAVTYRVGVHLFERDIDDRFAPLGVMGRAIEEVDLVEGRFRSDSHFLFELTKRGEQIGADAVDEELEAVVVAALGGE